MGEQIFEAVKAHLKANGMEMKQGTMIDTTIIATASSTQNEKRGGIRRCTKPARGTSGISV